LRGGIAATDESTFVESVVDSFSDPLLLQEARVIRIAEKNRMGFIYFIVIIREMHRNLPTNGNTPTINQQLTVK
jgi:hypothetical protein